MGWLHPLARFGRPIALLSALSLLIVPSWAGQAPGLSALALPDAPEPQTPSTPAVPRQTSNPSPCPAPASSPAAPKAPSPGDPSPPDPPSSGAVAPAQTGQQATARNCTPPNWYERFVRGPQDKRLTPKDKAWLAVRDVADPFNNITILGEAAISVASDPHSPYGPGMPGYGRYVGVSYTQDLTGEFFGTFLIPSIAHQDPHYHRMPNATYIRRVGHAIGQVAWTQGDNGKGMPNYANLVGFAIDDEISNLYVPGRETDASASATRYAIGLATAPIGNFINEFLPDVASHIHVQIVVIQRIINQVAKSAGGSPAP